MSNIRGYQVGQGFYDDQGNFLEEIGGAPAKPIVLYNEDNTVATSISNREDLMRCMRSDRYKTDARYREKIAELVANSDAVELGLEAPKQTLEEAMKDEYLQAKDEYVKSIFRDPRYATDPAYRYEVARTIAADPAMAEDLAAGRIRSVGDVFRIEMTKDEPAQGDNSNTNTQPEGNQ